MKRIPKFSLGPFFPLDAPPVELRDGQRYLVVHVLIEYAHEDYRKRCECQIDQQDVGVVEKVRAVEIIVDLVPKKCKRPDNVLGELAIA